MKMSKSCLPILSIFIILITSCFLTTQTHAFNKQAQALKNLYKTKLHNINKDYTSLFVDDTSNFNAVKLAVADGDGGNVRVYDQSGMKEKDRIDKLPGQPSEVEFAQYGGYVTTDESAGRALYYYFVEAPRRRSNKLPLLLWLNGGPGCSSLAYGAMQELGPFRVNSDGKTLFRNRYSWNTAANVLFLEAPAGVGFSYSNTTSDYSTSGDKSTSVENYVFLLNWLERFPEYKGREFYISGESYAGHYVPQLAHAILTQNKIANKTLINLKGIIIGNAVINDETDMKGMYDFWATHALVSDEINDRVHKYCDFSPNATKQRDECNNATVEAEHQLDLLDIYNIYAPLCASGNLTTTPKKVSVKTSDPCSDYYVATYLNRPDVQKALHANVTKLTHDWEACSDIIQGWKDSASTVIPLLREFMENELRVWIFSGDMDGRVPVTSTKYSIEEMKLSIKTPWHAWLHNDEVGGYVQVYKGDLTFATVRGAGHQVPSYQPARALSLIKHFLSGKPLPAP